jgi:hypothetical protein
MAKRQTIQWPKDRQYNGQKSEDTKGVIRRCKSKDRQYNGQKTEGQTIQWPKDRQYNGQKSEDAKAKRKKTKGQTMIYKTLHRKLKIEHL